MYMYHDAGLCLATLYMYETPRLCFKTPCLFLSAHVAKAYGIVGLCVYNVSVCMSVAPIS